MLDKQWFFLAMLNYFRKLAMKISNAKKDKVYLAIYNYIAILFCWLSNLALSTKNSNMLKCSATDPLCLLIEFISLYYKLSIGGLFFFSR